MARKPIPDFPGYPADRSGRIWSDRTGAALKPYMGGFKNRRPKVDLVINKKRYKKFVHDLICSTFIGPRPAGMLVCHRDDDPLNNKAHNLYYGTPRQNYEDAERNGRIPRGCKHPSSVLTARQRRQVVRRLPKESQRRIAASYGVSPSVIRRIALQLQS